jgi:CHAT domain-containing protein
MTSDGVYGLQRGLKNAGVKAMIVSLWSVDDEATSLLMQAFYRHLKTEDIHTAFHHAREELIATGREPSRRFNSKQLKMTKLEPSFDLPQFYNAFILIDIF